MSFATTLLLALAPLAQETGSAGERHALLCAKAVTCVSDTSAPQVFDDAVVLVEGDEIRAVGRRRELEIPPGYEVHDFGDAWIVPGLIDLHSHVGMEAFLADWNDGVYQVNPGLRVSVSTAPANQYFRRAVAGGVTSVLYLSGSGTNMSGAGVLLKTAPPLYEDALIRDPGALKIAQAGNPERWMGFFSFTRMERSWMNWNLRTTLRLGLRYARQWAAFEAGEGPEPVRQPEFDVFRDIVSGMTKVAVHTQIAQVVLMSMTMLRQEFGLPIFIDHGTFDGYHAAGLAQELGVPAILGPRSMTRSMNFPTFAQIDTDGRFDGVAARYQEAGHTAIGFNTDAVNFPGGGPWTEELPLQGAMGVRYGLSNDRMEVLRGLTIVPAEAAGIDDRVGSLEAGKDADLVVIEGDPTDPRNRVREVWVEGRRVFERAPGSLSW